MELTPINRHFALWEDIGLSCLAFLEVFARRLLMWIGQKRNNLKGFLFKIAINPLRVGVSFCLPGKGFVTRLKIIGTNSARIKRSETIDFRNVLDIFVALHHTLISGGFKYRPAVV